MDNTCKEMLILPLSPSCTGPDMLMTYVSSEVERKEKGYLVESQLAIEEIIVKVMR